MINSYTFDDVLLEPRFSCIRSRKDVDISTTINTLHLSIPLISANMATVTESTMALAMESSGGLGVLHRFCSIEDNIKMLSLSMLLANKVGVSIGVSNIEKERAEALYDRGAWLFFIDIANGASIQAAEQTQWLKSKYKDNICLVVGNFSTLKGIQAFKKEVGETNIPHVFKVGLGSGKICSSRLIAGHGVGQFSAVRECSLQDTPIISDGGARHPGHVVLALAAGAKAVMSGYLFAGTDETPGELKNGMKVYRGSAYHNVETYKTSEGVEMKIPYKGSVKQVIQHITGGIRSGLSYSNARNLKELRENANFQYLSDSTKKESLAG
ncbi:MAG: guanosine monophosphate reductase [Flavobacteriales bacterium]|nr:guanosine monophosphate reductase [Flavobacteriales bacterium]